VSAVAAVHDIAAPYQWREFHAAFGAHFDRVVAEPMVGALLSGKKRDRDRKLAFSFLNVFPMLPFWIRKGTKGIKTIHKIHVKSSTKWMNLQHDLKLRATSFRCTHIFRTRQDIFLHLRLIRRTITVIRG
jgi:hypothetical protein